MSIVHDFEAYKKHKWLAVYGASVALQVHQHMREGRGSPDADAMMRIREEASAVAYLDAGEDA